MYIYIYISLNFNTTRVVLFSGSTLVVMKRGLDGDEDRLELLIHDSLLRQP